LKVHVVHGFVAIKIDPIKFPSTPKIRADGDAMQASNGDRRQAQAKKNLDLPIFWNSPRRVKSDPLWQVAPAEHLPVLSLIGASNATGSDGVQRQWAIVGP
jgi:hypothetical protein